LHTGTQAGADWRVLMSAALIGSGFGLGLGAAYMAGGLGEAAADPSRAQYLAEAPAFDAGMVQREMVAAQPLAVRAATAMVTSSLATDLGQKKKARRGYSSDLECLTEAVYYEARSETPLGQAAVAQVVMNRVKHPAYPKTVCGVVFQGSHRRTGCQFSFTCDGSMRARRETEAWQRARSIAARTLAGVVLSDVGSATHYHTIQVSPAWGAQMRRVAQVGLHVFYRFNPRRNAAQPAAPEAVEAVLASLPAQGSAASDVRLTSAPAKLEPVEAPKPAPETAPAAEPAAAPKAEDAQAHSTAAAATAS